MNAESICNEILFLLKQNAVLLGMILFLAVMIFRGYRRGMMQKLLSFCSLAVTLFAEMKIFPVLMNCIENNSSLKEKFTGFGRQLLGSMVSHMLSAPDTAGTLPGKGDSPVNISFADSPLYHMLGLDVLADNAATRIGNVAAAILLYILLFIVIRLLVRVLMAVAKGLRRIRVIAWADGMLGAVFSFGESVLYIWLFMLVVSGFPELRFCRFCLEQITGDPILTMVWQHNLVAQLFITFLK